MSLNDLRLSPGIASALYQGSLVNLDGDHKEITAKVTKPTPAVQNESNETAFKFLGDNRKNILVMVSYAEAVHLPDDALTFLTNMLSACKLSLGDVTIVNRRNYPAAGYKELVSQFRSSIVFLFGVDPIDFGMPVSFPHYQVQNLANTTFLYSPSLHEQKDDPLLKSKLWVCLRNIFSI